MLNFGNIVSVFLVFLVFFSQTIHASDAGFESFYTASGDEHVASAKVISYEPCKQFAIHTSPYYLSSASFNYTLQFDIFLKENGGFLKDRKGELIRKTILKTIRADRASKVIDSLSGTYDDRRFYHSDPDEDKAARTALNMCRTFEDMIKANLEAWNSSQPDKIGRIP